MGTAFGVARLLGLHRHRPAHLDVENTIATLAGIADQAKSHGVLAVVGTPPVRRNALLRTGLHLVLRDPDQALVRSVLGEQAESEARKAAATRGIQTLAARVLAVLGVVGGLAAVAIMTLHAQAPGAVPAAVAAIIGLGAVCLALALTVTGPAVSALRAAAAVQAFEARVHEEAVLAIRDHADAAQTRIRLERLTPSAAPQAAAERQRRRAA